MTILFTTIYVLTIIASLVGAMVATLLFAERVWRRSAGADIIRRSEDLLRQAAVGMA